MERIVLKHLSGSKASKVEEFQLSQIKEIIIGRDPSSTVKYDPERDDLVGRYHAKITRDQVDPAQFFVTDLNSRNGTFVNKQRIVGTVRIMPGDVVQFGPGGPEFEFDLEPRPENAIKPTRVAADASAANLPATRAGVASVAAAAATAPAIASEPRQSIGKATVERMIAQTKAGSRRNFIIAGVAVVVLAAVIVAVVIYINKSKSDELKNQLAESQKTMSGEIGKTQEAMAALMANTPMSPADIVKNFSNSVMYLEVGWKLMYTRNGQQVFHEHIPNKWKDQQGTERLIVNDSRQSVATYIMMSDGSLEPSLSFSGGVPIGGEIRGSGFSVTNDGFIMTARSVAAPWRVNYYLDKNQAMGVVWVFDQAQQRWVLASNPDGSPKLYYPPQNWIPSETKSFGRQGLQGGFEGRLDYLNVTLPKTQTRIAAKLTRVSDAHDVALLKVDLPEQITKVELFDNYDNINPGESFTLLGYPSASPDVVGYVKSQDVNNPQTKARTIPDPSVIAGNVARVIRGKEDASGGNVTVSSWVGDVYQLTVANAGYGYNGAPIFDSHGRVIGIYFDAWNGFSYAVPIRFARELMGPSQVGSR